MLDFLTDLAALTVILCGYLALFAFASVAGVAAVLKLREVRGRGR